MNPALRKTAWPVTAGRMLVVGVLAALIPASAAAATPVLDTSESQVQIAADGTATVELTYQVLADPEGTEVAEVSLSSLDFGAAEVQDLQISDPQGGALDHDSTTVSAKTTTVVALAEPLQPGENQELQVSYTVSGAGEVDGETLTTNVPVLAMDHPAASAAPATFSAQVQLPAGHSLIEGFPSDTADVTETDGATVLHYQTPAVPSLLRAVSTEGQPTWWTTETQVQAILGLTIVVGLAMIYISFIRPQRRAAQAAAQSTSNTEPADEPVSAKNENRGL